MRAPNLAAARKIPGSIAGMLGPPLLLGQSMFWATFRVLMARQRNPDGGGLADCIATVEAEVAVPYSGP
jgi:hypothetical protein